MLWSYTSVRVMDSVMGQVSGLSVSEILSMSAPKAASSASLPHDTFSVDCRTTARAGTASSGTTRVPVFIGNGVVCSASPRNDATVSSRPLTSSFVFASTTRW